MSLIGDRGEQWRMKPAIYCSIGHLQDCSRVEDVDSLIHQTRDHLIPNSSTIRYLSAPVSLLEIGYTSIKSVAGGWNLQEAEPSGINTQPHLLL